MHQRSRKILKSSLKIEWEKYFQRITIIIIIITTKTDKEASGPEEDDDDCRVELRLVERRPGKL